MEDIGNIAYWIFIVGAIIVSSISSLKKKQKQQQEQQQKPPRPSQPQSQSWDEMWIPAPPPAPKKQKKAPPPVRAQHQRAQSSFAMPEEGESVFGHSAILAEETEAVIIDELGLTDADAFRKAVIYAEILNRKY